MSRRLGAWPDARLPELPHDGTTRRPIAGFGVDLANPADVASLYAKAGMTPLYRADVYRTELSGWTARPSARRLDLGRGGAGGPAAQIGDVVVRRAGLLGCVRDLRQIPLGGQAALVTGEYIHPCR